MESIIFSIFIRYLASDILGSFHYYLREEKKITIQFSDYSKEEKKNYLNFLCINEHLMIEVFEFKNEMQMIHH